MTSVEPLTVCISAGIAVSAILTRPADPRACFVMAHGAGAGMAHPFMTSVAEGLAERGLATLRYNFPYMEGGSKRPDRPPVAHATVRAAAGAARYLLPRVKLFAGGKSFGARMTSQAQALSPLPGVQGLVFFGFPLHPANKPSVERAGHLFQVKVPMLFFQGTRDALADMSLLRPLITRLGASAALYALEAADHSFHVLRRSGATDAGVMAEALDAMASWVQARPSRATCALRNA